MSAKKGSGAHVVVWFVLLSKLAKAAKFLKFTKPLLTFVTMSISAIAYAFWLGPWFAVGLIAMLFIHEMGHVMAMRARGYEASGPVFIPFIGAVIASKRITDRDDEAFIGIGGPAVGGLAAAFVFAGWWFLDDKSSDTAVILLMVSYIGAFLNVFNMIPMRPLDGGRVTQAIGPWFKYVGMMVLAAFSVVFREPVVLFIWILVLPDLTMLPLKLRAWMSTVLLVAMGSLMALGYSSQPFWVDIMDVILGGVFTLMLHNGHRHDIDPGKEDDARPALTREARNRWLVRYLLLAVILVGLMAYQIPHLPKPG